MGQGRGVERLVKSHATTVNDVTSRLTVVLQNVCMHNNSKLVGTGQERSRADLMRQWPPGTYV